MKNRKIGKVNYLVNLHFLPEGRSIEECVQWECAEKCGRKTRR